MNHLQQSLQGITMSGVKHWVKLMLSLPLSGAALIFLYSSTTGTLQIQSSLCWLQQRCGTAAHLFSGDGHSSEVSYLSQINYLIQYLFVVTFQHVFTWQRVSVTCNSQNSFLTVGGLWVFRHWSLFTIFALQYVLQPNSLKICCSVKHNEQNFQICHRLSLDFSNSIEYPTVTL